MARDRSIVVRLRAEVSDFKNQIGSASRSLSEFEQAQQKMGGAADTSMGRLVQSAKINEREWQNVGRTLLTAGAAVTGLSAGVAKVGIDYNSLRQNATQSLTAITGSTEVAGAQMRKLDEYGKNSWLMRDSLIRAQKDMTGFGIETRKVIPYMDGLAEAVAATGGSNQDFEELARLMGKIQSQGKITAVELMQFGTRGIDAATLIGEAMGKTGGQIRDEITAGTLDAGQALDALAEGMKSTYDGASDLVRDTFSGAVADVQAAFRDLAAAMTSGLVDPEGGGVLVQFLNKLADALRGLEGLPTPLLQVGGAVTVLAGATALATGAFMVALPKWVEFQSAVTTLSAAHPMIGKAGTAIGKIGGFAAKAAVGVAAASAALAALSAVLVDAAPQLEEMKVVLRDGDFDRGFSHLANGYNSLEEALRTLTSNNWFDKLDRGFQAVIGVLPGVTTAVEGSKEQFEQFGTILAEVASAGELDAMADQFNQLADAAGEYGVTGAQLLDLMPSFRDELIGMADAAGMATDDATLLAIATGEIVPAADEATGAVDEFGNAVDDASGSVGEQIDKLWALTQAHLDSANAVLGHRDAERRWYETLDRATEALEDNGATLDITTEKGRANEQALDDIATSGWALIEQMREQGATNTELHNSMENIRSKFVDTAVAFGMARDDAERLADQLGLIPSNVNTDVNVDTYGAQQTVDQFIRDNNGRQIRITTLNTVQTTGQPPGWQSGSMGQYGNYEGGWVRPGLQAGGWVPGSRAGFDNVSWPLYSGGRVLSQPLEGQEFVVRSSMARRYGPELEAMNAGRYNGGFAASSAGMTINVYGVPMNQAAEVGRAVGFEMRRVGRGGVHAGRGA